MPKLLAIDYGFKRCGIAVTDDSQIIASPLTTVETKVLEKFLDNYFSLNKVEAIILGEPLRLDGSDTHSSAAVRTFKEKLEKKYPAMPIHSIDERFTSKMAFQSMIDSGMSKKKRQDKSMVDQISAAIILQSFMSRRGRRGSC